MRIQSKPLVPLVLLALASLPAAAADPFYQGLLRDGQLAIDRKDYPAAIRDLRLACFGLLDEPPALVDCLARLALAQDRAEDLEGFRATFQRIVEVEERFSAYSQGGVAPELRAVLEPRLVARLPAATLEGVPAFRQLVAKKPAAPVAGNPSREPGTGREPARPPAPSPIAAAPAAPQGATPAPPGPETTPAKPPPAPQQTAAAAPQPLSDAERKKMDQVRQQLSRESSARELRQVFQDVRQIADAHLDSKEAQHLAAESAYRISRWSDAAVYFRRGGDPAEDQPERLFYMAVSLYESGDATAAADALRRALPNLRRTPYVDSYAKKILGQ